MDWTRDDTEIDRCIGRLRDDQRVQASVIRDSRRRFREDATEIAQLTRERAARRESAEPHKAVD